MAKPDWSDTEALDHKSAVPLYFQLQEILKERIELGVWRPGEPIPPEAELCEAFGVSRTVVRQALAVIEQDGQIRRSQGRRSIILPPKLESPADLWLPADRHWTRIAPAARAVAADIWPNPELAGPPPGPQA